MVQCLDNVTFILRKYIHSFDTVVLNMMTLHFHSETLYVFVVLTKGGWHCSSHSRPKDKMWDKFQEDYEYCLSWDWRDSLNPKICMILIPSLHFVLFFIYKRAKLKQIKLFLSKILTYKQQPKWTKWNLWKETQKEWDNRLTAMRLKGLQTCKMNY